VANYEYSIMKDNPEVEIAQSLFSSKGEQTGEG